MTDPSCTPVSTTVDVLIENVSLVASYRSQFDRVIRTSSYEELVKRLKDRGQP
jgi:ABC-type transporter MlaC component